KTAGLALDAANIDQVSAAAPIWEKVIRRVKSGSMPPVGRPRPDAAAASALVGWLEDQLDRAAAARPNPGRLPSLHRLTKSEYRNVVRDLLALDDLPREIDLSVLLPDDTAAGGFDNVADALFVSPTLLDSYLNAARKISRVAIGDPAAPETVGIYQ